MTNLMASMKFKMFSINLQLVRTASLQRL